MGRVLGWTKTLTGPKAGQSELPAGGSLLAPREGTARPTDNQSARTGSPKPAMPLVSLRLPGWQRNV